MKSIIKKEETFTHVISSPKSPMPHVHYHTQHELYYLKTGSTTYYVGDKIYRLQQGDFIFIPKGVLHKTNYEDSTTCERMHVYMDDSVFDARLHAIKEELLHHHIIQVSPAVLPDLETVIMRIQQESLQPDLPYSSNLRALCIRELLFLLFRHKQNNKSTLSQTDRLVYDVSKHIASHIQQPITLEILSEEFSTNKFYLSKKFKNTIGIGISEYVTYARITKAEELLCETDLSITEVAQQCGYNDSNYFSTVFKRVKGLSPQQYRNTNIGKEH